MKKKPTKEEMIQAIRTINNVSTFAAERGVYTQPIPSVVNLIHWVMSEWEISLEDIKPEQSNHPNKKLPL